MVIRCPPDVDLFASQLNAKILCYIAWKPDPNAFAIDAFTLNWSVFNLVYCFPPFSVIGKVLQKLLQYQTTAILVLPDWPTQFLVPSSDLNATCSSNANKSPEDNTNSAAQCLQSSPSSHTSLDIVLWEPLEVPSLHLSPLMGTKQGNTL